MCKTTALIPSLVFAFALQAKESSVVEYETPPKPTSYELVWSYELQPMAGTSVAAITGVRGKSGTSYVSPTGPLSIPQLIFDTETGIGYVVKRIENLALANSIGLTAITIPSIVESIGDSAFSNCTALASITIPEGVREIGKRPFVNTIISEITLPRTLLNMDGNIAAGAPFDLGNALDNSSHFLVTADGAVYNRDQTKLYACPTRTEGTLTLPDSLTEIGADAFYGCFRLTYLNIPANVAEIESGAFNVSGIWPGLNAPEAEARLKTIIFNGPPPDVADDAFEGAPAPADLSILTFAKDWPATWKGYPVTLLNPSDSNLPTLEHTDINGLKWRYRVLPDSVEIVELLSKTAAGVNVEELEEGRTNRKVVDVPRAIFGFPVTKLCDESFTNCSSITYLRIPQTVKEIGSRAFIDCTSLLALDSLDVAPVFLEDGHATIPTGVRKLGRAPFDGTPIEQLSLPSTLTEINGNPMCGCEFLASIAIADNNPNLSVADNVLYDKRKTEFIGMPANSDIKSISLPSSVKNIADDAFYGCNRLDTILLPEGLVAIGSNAFANCSALAKVAFEGAEPVAPDGIFGGSENVTVYGREENGWSGDTWKDRPLVVIPDGDDTALMQTINGITWRFRVVDDVAEIWNEGATAVESDSPIMSVALPQALGGYVVKGIGDGALANLRGITSVSIPSTYEWIGDSAFSNCTSLASIAIPEGVREIGHWPFYSTALTELSIPDSVSAIDGNPVAGAALMKSIKVSDSQPYFATDDGLLYDKRLATLLACPATKSSISLPDSVEEIADDAFYGCNILDGGDEVIDGVTWSFDFADGGAVVTAVEGATNNVVIPKTLGDRQVVAIEPTAFNDCPGITGFEVESGNTAFAAKNGALYSADGKTLIRVPDTYALPATETTAVLAETISETVIPGLNPDGTDATTTTRTVASSKSTTTLTPIAPTVPMDQLLDGVDRVADYAFFGCGAGFEPSETTQTNGVETATGFIGNSVYVTTTYKRSTVTRTRESVVLLPASVACDPDAFTGSGATEVRFGPTSAPPAPPAFRQPTQTSALDESSTYLGWISRNGIIDGSVTLKTAKMRKGVMKVSGSVQMLGEKKTSVRSVDAATPAGCELVIAKDVSKTGAFDRFKGKVVTLALGTLDNGGSLLMNGCSTLTVTISSRGKAKVSGYLADGTKVSVSAQMIRKDDKFLLPVFAPLYTGKKGGFAFVLDLSDVTPQVVNMSRLISIQNKTPYSVKLGGLAVGKPASAIHKDINFLESALPPGYSTNGELIGWRPRYTAKTGLVKGSFTVFNGTKKTKATVYGVMIGNVGYGTAVIKKTGSWSVQLD